MGDAAEKTYSLAEIVYESEKKFAESGYTIEQLNVSEEKRADISEAPKLNELQTQFKTSYSNMNKNINRIFELFGLANMQENFWTDRRYLLNEKEKEFLVILLKRYSEERIWKKGFKKIKPAYREFWNLFQSGLFGDKEILDEIEFVVDGLLSWFARLHNEFQKIEDFRQHLYLVTSLNDIKWAVSSKEILIKYLAILDDNEMGSFAFPKLMKEYSDYLENLTIELEDLMVREKNNWENIQKKRLKDATLKKVALSLDEEYNESIANIKEEVQKEAENKKGKGAEVDQKDWINVLKRKNKENKIEYQKFLEKLLGPI